MNTMTSDPFGVHRMRDASLDAIRLSRERGLHHDPNEHSRLYQAIEAIWSALRRLINAVLRALGLKQRVAHQPIKSEGDVSAQAQSMQQSLANAAQASQAKALLGQTGGAQADGLSQALRMCGFDQLQHALLLQIKDCASLDGAALARLAQPVFKTAAQQLTRLDANLLGMRQSLAEMASPLVEAFGGHPLLVEDALRMARQMPAHERPQRLAPIIDRALQVDEQIRLAVSQRDTVTAALRQFAAHSAQSGLDLNVCQVELTQIFGEHWNEVVAHEPPADDVDLPVRSENAAVEAAAAPLRARDRLRAMVARMHDDGEEVPPRAERSGDDDDDNQTAAHSAQPGKVLS